MTSSVQKLSVPNQESWTKIVVQVLQVPVRLEQKLHTGYIAGFTVHMLHHISSRPSGRQVLPILANLHVVLRLTDSAAMIVRLR